MTPSPSVPGRAGDPHAHFVQLFARSYDRLFGYILSLLGNRTDAEDVFQRTSIVLWKKFDRFDPETDFMAWASTVAFYEVRNFLRVAHPERIRFSDRLLEIMARERAEEAPQVDRRVEALEGCLEKIGEDNRDLVRQAYGEEASIKELAEQSGRPVQTLYNKLNVIRQLLVECVRKRLAQAGSDA